jgi:two-component system cell cycle response regulator DivK
MIVPGSSTATARAPARPVVLLVDGHRDTLDMYAYMLSREGFDVDTADDGAEATSRLSCRTPAIIVVEPALGGAVSGDDFCRRVRSLADTRATPLLAVTGRVLPSDTQRAIGAGCDVVLTKPCLPETLVREVQRLLRRAPLAADGRIGSQAPPAPAACDG